MDTTNSSLAPEQVIDDLFASLAYTRRLMLEKLVTLRKEHAVEDANHELTIFETSDEEGASSSTRSFLISGHVEATLRTGDVLLWWLEVKRSGMGWLVVRGVSVDGAPSRDFDSAELPDSASLSAALPALVTEQLSVEARTKESGDV